MTLVVHTPPQKATAVKLWRKAQWVSSEALAKEDTLRRVPPKTQKGPRLLSRGAPHIIGAIKTVLSLDLSPSLRVEPEWGRRLDGARDTALADGARTIINNVG